MHICIISGSLNPASSSHLMAREAEACISGLGHSCQTVRLTDYDLPLCDGGSAYQAPDVKKITTIIKSADGILLVTPVYNYDGNAAVKNIIELTGAAWEDKPVGLMCSAGGERSYMALMPLANSLMLDFRCVIVPRFVYALERDFDKAKSSLINPAIHKRIRNVVEALIHLGR